MTSKEFLQEVERTKDQLFLYAVSLERNHEKARDLQQDVLLLAFKNKHRFIEGSNFKAWITTIMRNNFITQYRRRKNRECIEMPLEDASYYVKSTLFNDNPEKQIFYKELLRIVHELPEKQKQPFLLHIQGFKYDEIAEQLNIPDGTLKSRIHFARKALQEKMKSNGFERIS